MLVFNKIVAPSRSDCDSWAYGAPPSRGPRGMASANEAAMMVLPSLQRSTRMDAVTPQTADTHSHIVRPQHMEWQKTRFPGCEAKTLLFDRATGLMTALMRFA